MSSVATRLRSTWRGARSNRVPMGGLDRAHDGLVSGWFNCPGCPPPAGPLPTLALNGLPIKATVTATSRSDIPGGIGFVVRFPPTGTSSPRIQVQCPLHPRFQLALRVDQKSWEVAALGAIESSVWPVVSGWFALLDPDIDNVELRVQGCPPLRLGRTLMRPDLLNYLGVDGVAGFHVDLGNAFGTAMENGSHLLLRAGAEDIAAAQVCASPIDSEDDGCLPPPEAGMPDPADLADLRRRFLNCEVDTAEDDWHVLVRRVGLSSLSEETHQWAEFFAHQGCTPQDVAARLVLRHVGQLGAEALDPLPASLDRALTTRGGAPAEIASVIAVGVDAKPARPAQRSTDELMVAVAGLVYHKSGLGLSATSSIRVLDDAGIHACAAPFFPARGGWNRRLRPTPGSLRALRDHVTLLHLPLDRVISSLSAQPALLASRKLIGYYYWETEVVPTQFHRALNVVDEVWCASEFVADAFRSVTQKPVRVTGQVVDVTGAQRLTRSDLAIAESAFVVHFALDANSTVARKNPNAAIDAFDMAFDGDPSAVLLLKIRNFQYVETLARSGDSHADGLLRRIRDHSNIRLVTGEHSRAFTLGLIQLANCYLSLHRSEGYGYGIAEAMALGTPVITTGYSGNMDLTSEQTAWLVPFDLQGVLPGEYPFWEAGMFWAKPDTYAASSLLHDVRYGDLVRTRVHMARVRVGERESLEAVAARYSSLVGRRV